MIELRQRSSSSRNSGGYQRLSLDEDELDIDEEEDVPLLNRSVPISQPVESSSCTFLSSFIITYHTVVILNIFKCLFDLDPSICLVFSLSGIIFLSSIYYLVRKNSPYLKLNETTSSSSTPIDNEFIAEGILNSIFMYCICAALSAFFMYRSSFQRQRDRRFED